MGSLVVLGDLLRQAFNYRVLFLSGLLLSNASLGVSNVLADTTYASKERSTISRAHMSRARTLLVEALAEFEEGRKYAQPDLLLDSEDWRLRVVSLTEQLNRVIDPKPRITREGAVFRAPPRFIKREKDNLPTVASGAKSRSDVGEKERLKEKQNARAKLYEDEKKIPLAAKSDSENKNLDSKNQRASIDDILDDLDFDDDFSEPQAKPLKKGKNEENLKDENKESSQKSASAKSAPLNSSAVNSSAVNSSAVKSSQSKGDAKGDETYLDDDDFEDTATGKMPSLEDSDLESLPEPISDSELDKISPEVADSRLIDDEELTKRLERSLSDK